MSASRIITGAIAALVALGVLGSPGLAAPAAPEVARTWSESFSTVCVESHVSRAWGVKGAISRWHRLEAGPTFVLKKSCPQYEGTVTVNYEKAGTHGRYNGWTEWYWDETGDIVHADVTFNPRSIKKQARDDRSCLRKHTSAHEFGHVLGLPHYPDSQSGAVMSYLGWDLHCGGLTAHDRSDYKDLYGGR